MNKEHLQREALARATQSPSMSNYPAIYAGFEAKGIPAADIEPRVNVFSFHAWKALGRSVRKGEHGVKIATVRKGEKTDKETGEVSHFSTPWFVTVFHVSQTDPIGPVARNPDAPSRERLAAMLAERAQAVTAFAPQTKPARPASTEQAGYYSTEFTRIGA